MIFTTPSPCHKLSHFLIQEELGRTTDDLAVHSRYPKQQMKMIEGCHGGPIRKLL